MICSGLLQIGNFGPSLKQLLVPEHSANAEQQQVGQTRHSRVPRPTAGSSPKLDIQRTLHRAGITNEIGSVTGRQLLAGQGAKEKVSFGAALKDAAKVANGWAGCKTRSLGKRTLGPVAMVMWRNQTATVRRAQRLPVETGHMLIDTTYESRRIKA
jgi:hypothetical protein